jgi:hypothetical protein
MTQNSIKAKTLLTYLVLGAIQLCGIPLHADEPLWKKHIVHDGAHTLTAVAADFTGDGKVDIISNSDNKTRLFVAPDWREIIIDDNPDHGAIHSEFFDIDGDGDQDYIGVRYSPGLIFWLECPEHPLTDKWTARIVDDEVNGIHGLLKGDIDGDGKFDLIAPSGQPTGKYPNSGAWLRVPNDPHAAERWERYIFADRDAAGLSHYVGFGDINGDGRPDISMASKGGPQAEEGAGQWFAWWEAPADPKGVWKRHTVAENQLGATNIMPGDINGDKQVDLIATRGHDRGVFWYEAPDWKPHVIHPTLLEPHSLAVLDMDEDGDIDAATCGYGDKQVYWFENDGHGKFNNHLVANDQAAYDIRAVDIDSDGDIDLLIAGQTSKNVAWYENPAKRGLGAGD